MLAGVLAGAVPSKYLTRVRISLQNYVFQLTPTQAETLKLVSYLNPAKGVQDEQQASSGAFATTFRDADGRVVKITGDPDDVLALLVLQGVTPRVPKVYAAYQMDDGAGGKYYAVIVEYIHSFKRDNWAHFDQAMRVTNGMHFVVGTMSPRTTTVGGRVLSWDVDRDEAKQQACVGPDTNKFRRPLTSDQFGMMPEACNRLMDELLDISERVAPYGLRLVDTHTNNMGLRDPNDADSWVIRDLGASGETDSKPPVPTLAGLSETQLARIFRRLS